MMYNSGEFLLSGDLCIDDILSLVQGNGLATDDPGNVHPGQKADDQDNVLKSRFQEGIHNDHDHKVWGGRYICGYILQYSSYFRVGRALCNL